MLHSFLSLFFSILDTTNMPKSEKIISKKDSSPSENGSPKPETSSKNQEDKTSSEVHSAGGSVMTVIMTG